MEHQKKWKKAILIVLPIFMVISITACIPFRTALVFYDGKTDKMAAFLPMEKGGNFQVVWKHSIHLTDVTEKYQLQDNGDIKQYEIVYEHFGIGMPSYALKGEKFTYKNGKYHISNLENVFPEINIRNGKTVSKHRLVWGKTGEHMVWFNQYLQPGAWYKMKAKKLSWWTYLKGVKVHE
ncbi:DUF1850 domain-containing protein [Virgibacillus halophilus]|uniref:DUF1850 domain-containing protein n=1 Tax=Tigheibacillus halophilus TaxID=361280 RepID=A0ABU5C4T4_9BACI|nr:DUF1850 domain-containing protein [Virgibacillus halophilus]